MSNFDMLSALASTGALKESDLLRLLDAMTDENDEMEEAA